LEALLAGTVVVATSVGGVPELLGGGAGGRLVPPGSAASIADAIQEVIGMSLHDVTQLREHGFELAMSEFSFSRMVIGVEKVYGLVLQKLPTQEIKWTT
jgi:glycosyltransferase involved in cell wall biosynthesis